MKRLYHLKRFYLAIAVILTAAALCACSDMESAVHSSYTEADKGSVESNYGKGNYVYAPVTFTGDGLGKETVLSVKELEQKAIEEQDLGYEGNYSFLTRGSVFTTHKMAGIKLYQLLLSLGMDESLSDDTEVTAVAQDGYTTVLTLGDLRSDRYGIYDGIGGIEPKESGIPILLAFGSDGIPLVGPTGSEKAGKTFTEEEGYKEKADNVGGPVRLIIGQMAANDFNAPQNGKWLSTIIVGEKEDYTRHDETSSQKTAVTVSVYDSSREKKLISSTDYTFADLEKQKKQTERNYYGKEGFYEGVNLWSFLTKQVGISSQEGTATFRYEDGGSETVDLDYIRNMGGDFEDYTTKRDGLTITCVKPALGYSKDGKASDGQVFAMLPAKKGVKEESTASVCTAVEVVTDGSERKVSNPYRNRRISIEGNGVKKAVGYTISQMEKDIDLQVKDKDGYSGVSLMGLLEKSGLAVDADQVTIASEKKTVTYSLAQLKKKKDQVLLATRKDGKALDAQQGPVHLTGSKALDCVVKITVKAKNGQWTHRKEPYKAYLDHTLKITGPEAKQDRTYTLKELESLSEKYTVKDSFGASAGINGYQGVSLKALIQDNLKENLKKPTKVTIVGKDGYTTTLSVEDIYKGIDSNYQKGQHRFPILAYSIDGIPLVGEKADKGYKGNNDAGPLKLIVENQISKWVKNVEEIRLGK